MCALTDEVRPSRSLRTEHLGGGAVVEWKCAACYRGRSIASFAYRKGETFGSDVPSAIAASYAKDASSSPSLPPLPLFGDAAGCDIGRTGVIAFLYTNSTGSYTRYKQQQQAHGLNPYGEKTFNAIRNDFSVALDR